MMMMKTYFSGKKYIQELALQISRELISSSKGCDYSISNTIEWPEPTLYLITPTYRRPEQLAELTRMAQTLMHVRNLVWLVIEDANSTTELVTKLLDKTGIEYHHMIGETETDRERLCVIIKCTKQTRREKTFYEPL